MRDALSFPAKGHLPDYDCDWLGLIMMTWFNLLYAWYGIIFSDDDYNVDCDWNFRSVSLVFCTIYCLQKNTSIRTCSIELQHLSFLAKKRTPFFHRMLKPPNLSPIKKGFQHRSYGWRIGWYIDNVSCARIALHKCMPEHERRIIVDRLRSSLWVCKTTVGTKKTKGSLKTNIN